ncbi:MAG: tetratricopeptide repeat protein [Gemmatimonadota bacterium]
MTFFAELKRRRVVRVGLVYGAFAFAALEGADVLIEALGMPAWALRATAFSLIVGFPVALALAWLFQITPDGVRRAETTGTQDAAHATWVSPASLAAVAVLVLAGGAGGWLIRSETGGTLGGAALTATIPSIAVLAFDNLSGNPENDYFGAGLAEEVLNALARIPDLKVAARTSAFAYRGQNVDVRAVGRDLGVRMVLEGSVRQSGDTVRILARLHDAEEGTQVWSNTFGGRLDDVFAVQDSISRTIARSLEVTFSEDARRSIRQAAAASPEAHDAYLRGLYMLNQRGEVGILGAIREFSNAVELDPAYAAAYAGLAIAWRLSPFYTDSFPPPVAYDSSATYAERALQLGPALAEAHAAMAQSLRPPRGSAAEEIRHYERAIELQPSYAPAYQWLGELLSTLGRHEEALGFGRKAVELDPANLAANLDLGRDYWRARRYREAEDQLNRTLELDPTMGKAVESLGRVYMWTGRWDEAEEAFRRGEQLGGADADGYVLLLRAYRAHLETGEPQTVNWDLFPEASTPGLRAFVYAAAGRAEEALAQLAAADEFGLLYFDAGINAPYWDSIRDDSEFQTHMNRLLGN